MSASIKTKSNGATPSRILMIAVILSSGLSKGLRTIRAMAPRSAHGLPPTKEAVFDFFPASLVLATVRRRHYERQARKLESNRYNENADIEHRPSLFASPSILLRNQNGKPVTIPFHLPTPWRLTRGWCMLA